jgi:hypothetical protein
MATQTDLALRALKKSGNLGAEEAASAPDLELALEKLRAAHLVLKTEKLLRWTITTIPPEAEEPMVMLTAFLLQPEFERQPDPLLWSMGMSQIAKFVNLPSVGVTQAEYF